ncbi:hypothetical protein ES705_40185 [subsurface metagenome]
MLLAIFITLISGVPAVDSLNKSIETLKDLPNFMETQTEVMNRLVETLEGLPDFMETQTEVMNKSVVILEEIHGILIKPEPQ